MIDVNTFQIGILILLSRIGDVSMGTVRNEMARDVRKVVRPPTFQFTDWRSVFKKMKKEPNYLISQKKSDLRWLPTILSPAQFSFPNR